MKRTILLSFLTLFVFLTVSCDKDKAKTDGDIITDADVITTDVDTEPYRRICGFFSRFFLKDGRFRLL